MTHLMCSDRGVLGSEAMLDVMPQHMMSVPTHGLTTLLLPVPATGGRG